LNTFKIVFIFFLKNKSSKIGICVVFFTYLNLAPKSSFPKLTVSFYRILREEKRKKRKKRKKEKEKKEKKKRKKRKEEICFQVSSFKVIRHSEPSERAARRTCERREVKNKR